LIVAEKYREGASADNRWKWNLTIGPVEDRPGRWGDWGYYNSDELGKSIFVQPNCCELRTLISPRSDGIHAMVY
jgi:alpha-L-arabinofuranosidase